MRREKNRLHQLYESFPLSLGPRFSCSLLYKYSWIILCHVGQSCEFHVSHV